MNTTVLVALITGLFTTVPNMLNNYFNNKQQLELKKFETDEIAKRQAIIDFSDSVASCISYQGTVRLEDLIMYQKALDKLLLYFPNTEEATLEKIENALHVADMRAKQKAIQPLIKQLSKELFEKQ